MKADIHPEYKKATVRCVCGNTWETRSTAGDIQVDICSQCHPFFTGKQKLVDTAGRVERFRKRYAKVGALRKARQQAVEGAEGAPGSAGQGAPAEGAPAQEPSAPPSAQAPAEAPEGGE